MRRTLLALGAALVLTAPAGCYNVVYPNVPKAPHPDGDSAIWAVEEPEVTPSVLGEYELCAFAVDAVHTIVMELFGAKDDAALVTQTVVSYRKYATRLRELAAKADTEARRKGIVKAAVAAEAYARAVEKRKKYEGVDIGPAVAASQDAFPGCDLD